tara:strand:+ start:58055 stop:58171 length:117 start_codon:yes stop_codon:yes gene_type:complete
MRSSVCHQACLYGTVDNNTRAVFLKYNTYLRKLKNEKK